MSKYLVYLFNFIIYVAKFCLIVYHIPTLARVNWGEILSNFDSSTKVISSKIIRLLFSGLKAEFLFLDASQLGVLFYYHIIVMFIFLELETVIHCFLYFFFCFKFSLKISLNFYLFFLLVIFKITVNSLIKK